MVEPVEQPAQSPPKPDARIISTEGPKDNKNALIAQLRKIHAVVSETNDEIMAEGSTPFNERAKILIKLGADYTDWLDANKDKVPDDKTFKNIVAMAKSAMLMNIKQYVAAVQPIGQFVSSDAALNELNPPGKQDGPWSGIKEVLYHTPSNDAREKLREGILMQAKELVAAGELDPRQLDHMERFLVDPKGRPPSQFIPEYIATHAGDIVQWSPLGIEDFQGYVITNLGIQTGDLSRNDFLRRLDEELASIKPENLKSVEATKKTQYADREKKLAFIRDLRFGRIDFEEVKANAAKRANEISRRPDLKSLAPHLRSNYPAFMRLLQDTAGQDPAERREIVSTLVGGYDMTPEARQAVLDYIEQHLK